MKNYVACHMTLWSQCSENMRERVENAPNFAEFKATSDGLALLQVIKNILYNYVSTDYKVAPIVDALIQIVTFKQDHGMSTVTISEGKWYLLSSSTNIESNNNDLYFGK